MQIVSILNQKGGSGKTTLSTNVARFLKLKGFKVLLIDSDPQGSARDWHAASGGTLLNVIGLDRPTLDKDLTSIQHNFDWVVIDGAPQLANMSIAAIRCSDVVLIPVQPSPYDVWASEGLVDIVKERQSITNGRPKVAFIVSRQINNTLLGKEVREALNGYAIPVFKHGTFQRIAYAKTAASGKTVLDEDPNSESAKEITLIGEELLRFSCE
jgi:chromosome partitioning protein